MRPSGARGRGVEVQGRKSKGAGSVRRKQL